MVILRASGTINTAWLVDFTFPPPKFRGKFLARGCLTIPAGASGQTFLLQDPELLALYLKRQHESCSVRWHNKSGKKMKKILIVDDEPYSRKLLKEILQKNYQLEEAGDGEKAVELFQGNQFDLVVLDMVLPQKDGLEVLREIKNHSPETVVIAISADKKRLADARAQRADETAIKPVIIDDFLRLVDSLTGQSAPG